MVQRPNLEPEPPDTFRILAQELRFARTMASKPMATYVLLGVLGGVFVILMLLADVLTSQLRAQLPVGQRIPYDVLLRLGAKNNAAIAAGEVWRLGTSVLLHGNLLHLLMNGYALYVLGTVLERLYGVKRFLTLFFVSGLGGAVASYLFIDANSVGASGAIFGLLGAAVVFGIKFRGILPSRIQRMLTVGLLPWVVLNVFIGSAFPGIDNGAHMGGLATGCLLAAVLGTRLRGEPPPTANRALTALMAVMLSWMAYSVVGAIIDAAPCVESVPTLKACEERLLGGDEDPVAPP